MQLPAFVDLTCRRVTELAGAYMAGAGLSAEERARFEQHLYACTWCMTYVQQLRQTARAAARLAVDTKVADSTQLLALFRAATRTPPPASHPFEEVASIDTVRSVEPPPRAEPAVPATDVTDRIAFKFLVRGAVSPLSGHVWAKPREGHAGAWLDVEGPLVPCHTGVHACRAAALAHWLHDELWLIELAGPVAHGIDTLVARRARLVREVTAWSAGGAAQLAAAARERATDLATSADARRCLEAVDYFCAQGNVAMTAFCAALTVARQAGGTQFDQQAFDDERRWQSDWIVATLGVEALRAEAERAKVP